jgi:hypothetical protein
VRDGRFPYQIRARSFENTTDPQPKGNVTIKGASMGYGYVEKKEEKKKKFDFLL